jgi:hypothetical protein
LIITPGAAAHAGSAGRTAADDDTIAAIPTTANPIMVM